MVVTSDFEITNEQRVFSVCKTLFVLKIKSTDMKNIFDAHMHYFYGSCEDMKHLLSTSPYKDSYFVYHSVNLGRLDIDAYLSTISGAFLMPFILKETIIPEANRSLFEYSKKNSQTVYPIPLVDEDPDCLQYIDIAIGAKEHFIKHNAFACEKREKAYNHLDAHKKFLILHCGDNVRYNYVEYLLQRYKNMRIVLAHLGVNRRERNMTEKVIKKYSVENRVYFDTSTIFDIDIIKFALSIIPVERIFFGSDTPFVLRENPIEDAVKIIMELNISDTDKENNIHKNVIEFINN